MDKALKQNLVSSAISAQNELVFTYRSFVEPDKTTVRFATPMSLEGDIVKCAQHLPEDGFRNFKLDGMESIQRVASLVFFPTVYQKDVPQA